MATTTMSKSILSAVRNTAQLGHSQTISTIVKDDLPTKFCSGNPKFDECIQRIDIPRRIRTRTDSCAVGSQVVESFDEIKKQYEAADAAAHSSKASSCAQLASAVRIKFLVMPLFHSSSPLSPHSPPPPPPFPPLLLSVTVCQIGSSHVM